MDAQLLTRLLGQTKNLRNVSIIAHVGQGKTIYARDIVSTASSLRAANAAVAEKNQQNGRGEENQQDGSVEENQQNGAVAEKNQQNGGVQRTNADWDHEDDLSIYDDDGSYDSDEEHGQKKDDVVLETTMCTMVHFQVGDEDLPLVQDSDQNSKDFLITVLDPDGHLDIKSEVMSAVRITDGCIVIMDCVVGAQAHTDALMKLALAEHTRPVLLINRVDICVTDLELEPEQLYGRFVRCTWAFNSIVETYGRPEFKVDPSQGSVAFGSGLQGWAFTVHEFARMYTEKFKIEFHELKNKLWGDNYYNQRKKTWTTTPGPTAVRGFLQFILTPLYTIMRICSRKSQDEILKFATTMDFKLTPAEKLLSKEDLLPVIMKKWMPASKTLLNLIVFHLPSPVTVQAKKTELLFEDITDSIGTDMKTCNADGVMMMYVSRLVPSATLKGKIYAVGRIFSGTVTKGQEVFVQDTKPLSLDESKNSSEATVESVGIVFEGVAMEMEMVPCGVVCGLLGVDQYIVKSGTISSSSKAQPIKPVRDSTNTVVYMTVAPKLPRLLPHVNDALKQLEKTNTWLQVDVSEVGELRMWGTNEAYVTECIDKLKTALGDTQVTTRGPFLRYRETVTTESSMVCRSWSSNGKNMIGMKANKLTERCVGDIEQGIITSYQDESDRALYLEQTHKMQLSLAKKIWCFGPQGQGPNMLIDATTGTLPKYIEDVEPTFVAAFQWATQKGVLCEEQMRGVRYDIVETEFHASDGQRSNKEMFPAVVKALKASALTAKPRLMQPVFKVEIECPESASPAMFDIITKRHGLVTREKSVMDWDTCYVDALLPAAMTFGLEKELKSNSEDAATVMLCVFDHWEALPGSPLDESSKTTAIIREIRKRKGLTLDIPIVDDLVE